MQRKAVGVRALRWVLAMALPMAVLVTPALAQAPSPVSGLPQLRIDTGAHHAPIRALDIDAQGRFAVTASEDKTARIWDLFSGELLQTLRPPIGADNDGKLFAAGITPDGLVVAVGGWSAGNDVYLFNRATGAMIQRITGLPDVIVQLAFSPDGRSLLIGMLGKNGVRLFASDSMWLGTKEVDGDLKYEGEVYGAQFSPDGRRLATASYDGQVRLYDLSQGRLQLIQSTRPAGGRQPFNVAFAPDGSLLAVSFSDSSAVVVLQADSLRPAFTPSAAGAVNGSLNALAWSADGRELMAAGTWRRADGRHGLKRWADRGRGAATEVSLTGNSVVALRALADGRAVYAGTDPVWGWLPSRQAAGTAPASSVGHAAIRSGLEDFRHGRAAFRANRDGSAIAYASLSPSGTVEPLGFDLRNAAWIPSQTRWNSSGTQVRGLAVADWFESIAPKLNGRTLALTDHEVSMTAAVAGDASGFVLGTSLYLRFYKADGTMAWRVASPGTVWQVNLTEDGRWVIAAFSDGTVRWYRVRDGVELLAVLPHTDRKRWVAWTQRGYYAASPGGEDLVGWHLNRGAAAAADFFPASRLRTTYFRPDLIEAVLTTADLDAALKLVERSLVTSRPAAAPTAPANPAVVTAPLEPQTPPVVTVLSPRDGDSFASREVLLSVAIRAPAGAPPLSIRARLNGSIFELPQAQISTGPGQPGGTASSLQTVRYEQRVTLPAQDLELLVFADNRNGYSTPAALRLKWAGAQTVSSSNPAAPPSVAGTAAGTHPNAPLTAAAGVDLRPALYVLAVGVSKYRNQSIQLAFASKDATDFANVLKLQDKRLYRKVDVKLLTDGNAGRANVLDGLEWIRREMTARDVGVVFLAGHGVNDSDGVYYYLPQDTDIDKLKSTGVIFTEIKNTLSTLPGKALFFVDTCHSGNVLGTGRRNIGNDLTAVVNELSSAENGVIVFAASTGRQFAQESPEWNNGAFTKAVIEGMSGKADAGGTGRVTHKMLDLYISERVKALTKGLQSPVTIVPHGISDFPLAFSR